MQIPLHDRTGAIKAYTLLDPEDAVLGSAYRWCLSRYGYATALSGGRKTRRSYRLHRLVLGLEPGDPRDVDHINGDRLDNRRANLRVATRAQNLQNTRSRGGASRHRGVVRCSTTGAWRAQAQKDGRHHYIGRFDTEEEAARAAADWRAEHMPYATN